MHFLFAILLSAIAVAVVVVPLHFILKLLPKQEPAPVHEASDKEKDASPITYVLIVVGVALTIWSIVQSYRHQEPTVHRASHKAGDH